MGLDTGAFEFGAALLACRLVTATPSLNPDRMGLERGGGTAWTSWAWC
jgi:hypothetical protein